MGEKIRVGIIGAGGWGKYGPIPVLQSMDDFEITSVSSRKLETAQELAAQLGVRHAFGDYQQLADHPEVDWVVILAPAAEHARLARAAIAAGKDVYSEWPLTATTAESAELLALAEAKGVRHVVGLQRRFAPSIRYAAQLIENGYVGKFRGVRMSVGIDAFQPVMPQKYMWTTEPASFTHLLSVYAAHFNDVLFHLIGVPDRLTAVVETQFPFTTVQETGEQVPYSNPNEVMVIGTLSGGGLFAVQLEGGQKHRTGLHLEIMGTEGVLRITNVRGFQNVDDNSVEGMRGGEEVFKPLAVPAMFRSIDDHGRDASAHDVAYLFDAYARDRREGTTTASSFKEALLHHQIIDQILQSSGIFFESPQTEVSGSPAANSTLFGAFK